MALVLIAEDDEDIAVILTRLLKRAGHTVLHEPDGVAALGTAVAERPDVLLTDLGMPRMDGLDLTRAVRAHPDLGGMPIIMLSGQLHPGDTTPAQAGVCAVLLKPCPNDRVVALVGELSDRGAHEHSGDAAECLRQTPVNAWSRGVETELLLDRLTNYARMIEIVEPVLATPGARTY